LSYRGPDAGNKEVQRIEEDGGKWQRWDEERDQKDTSELDQVEPSGYTVRE